MTTDTMPDTTDEAVRIAQEIRAGMEGVTPGEWLADPDDRPGYEWNVHIVEEANRNMRICFMSVGDRALANAAHIARCSPDRLTILLNEFDARGKEIERLRSGPGEPNPEWEAKADAHHAAIVAEVGTEPFATLTMLKRWKADAEPANELGQVSFSRAMLDSATDALQTALEIGRTEYLRAQAAEAKLVALRAKLEKPNG